MVNELEEETKDGGVDVGEFNGHFFVRCVLLKDAFAVRGEFSLLICHVFGASGVEADNLVPEVDGVDAEECDG